MPTPVQLTQYLRTTIMAKQVAMIHGPPGAGKSDIVREVAEKFNLEVIDIRLSQMDPTELMGYPKLDGDKGTFVPMDLFPLQGDPLPEGKAGWCLFFDEITSVSKSVEAAAYKIILDKHVGMHKLHHNVVMVCAGNRNTDGAVATKMGTAMSSRMMHFDLEVSTKDWILWANNHDIDHRIVSFMEFRPNAVSQFDPKHMDHTFPCPRTWAILSSVLKKIHQPALEDIYLLEACIGKGMARDFFAYLQVANKMPTIGAILSNPTKITIPEEPHDLKIALTGLASHHANEGNLDKIIQFLMRLPIENQVVGVRNIVQKDASLFETAAISEWTRANANEILM